jgi:hypothetical protein
MGILPFFPLKAEIEGKKVKGIKNIREFLVKLRLSRLLPDLLIYNARNPGTGFPACRGRLDAIVCAGNIFSATRMG